MSDANWLYHDHGEYEAMLEACRQAAEREDWKRAARLFDELVSRLRLHMRMEEEVVFPAYEEATGGPQAPTRALREEHDEIVRLLRDLATVLKTNDSDRFLESLAPLVRAMTRHHEKEEQIFLPMASELLLTHRDEILRRLESHDASHERREWDM